MRVLDIKWKNPYPANVLSNFYANKFIFDGVECVSMEGFLQALKYRSKKRQLKICGLSGKKAKNAGKRKILWRLTGVLYWQGKKFYRDSKEFDELRLRAYNALLDNQTFYKAFMSTKENQLTHSIGKHDKRKTILTEEEFIGYLEILRSRLQYLQGENNE